MCGDGNFGHAVDLGEVQPEAALKWLPDIHGARCTKSISDGIDEVIGLFGLLPEHHQESALVVECGDSLAPTDVPEATGGESMIHYELGIRLHRAHNARVFRVDME